MHGHEVLDEACDCGRCRNLSDSWVCPDQVKLCFGVFVRINAKFNNTASGQLNKGHKASFTTPFRIGGQHGDDVAYIVSKSLQQLLAPAHLQQRAQNVGDMAVDKFAWKTFYALHQAYFDSRVPDSNASFLVKYNYEARAIWNAYNKAGQGHIKLRYNAAGNRSQVLYEPPQISNNWAGAPLPPPPVQPAQMQSMGTQTTAPQTAPLRSDFPLDPGNSSQDVELPEIMSATQVAAKIAVMPEAETSEEGNREPKDKDLMMKLYDANDVLGDRTKAETRLGQLLKKKAPKEISMPNNRIWKRLSHVGSGGFGTASFWKLIETETGNVLESVVIKDVLAWKHWSHISAFSTDARDVPREVAAHRTACASLPGDEDGSRYILGYRGFRLSKSLRCFRIATEPAPLGTLGLLASSFIPRYGYPMFRQCTPENPKPLEDFIWMEGPGKYEGIPIVFVWRLFGALVRGCQHLEKRRMLHRDLKPFNIFLRRDADGDDPMMGDWGVRPLIADFGGAMPIDPVRYDNPADFDETCTPFYTAPESYVAIPPFVEASDGSSYPMTEKTDVFALGATIWAVLVGGDVNNRGGSLWPMPYSEDAKSLYNDEHNGVSGEEDQIDGWLQDAGWLNATTQNENTLHERYFERYFELVGVIRDCLRFNPDDRPSLDELDERIKGWLKDNDEEWQEQPTGAAIHTSADATSKFDYWFERLTMWEGMFK